MMKILLFSLLAFALLFSDETQGYVFGMNFNNDITMDIESVVEYSQGSFDFYMLFSARQLWEFEKPSISSNKTKLTQTFKTVVSSMRRNDEMKPNHDVQKLTGTSYTITIDSLGYIESTVGNSELAQEVVEESETVNWLFGINTEQNNIKYFMGGDTLRNVGDVWTTSDTTFDADETFGFEKFKGSQINKAVYSFKKIKEKKGDLIAWVDCRATLDVNGVGVSWDDTVEFSQIGEFKGFVKINITKGYMVLNKMNGAMQLKGKSLENDKTWNATIDVSLKQKGKIK